MNNLRRAGFAFARYQREFFAPGFGEGDFVSVCHA
jgi:hypothetical protein